MPIPHIKKGHLCQWVVVHACLRKHDRVQADMVLEEPGVLHLDQKAARSRLTLARLEHIYETSKPTLAVTHFQQGYTF